MSTSSPLHRRTFHLHLAALLLFCLLAASFPATSHALTYEQDVTPAYVTANPQEWSVKYVKKANGLIHFTIVRKLVEPKYLVAHLAVHHGGKLIASSDTPLFGKAKGNTFYFALAAEDVATSTFALSESGLGSTIDGKPVDIPVVGSVIHRFHLKEYLPEEMLKPGPGK